MRLPRKASVASSALQRGLVQGENVPAIKYYETLPIFVDMMRSASGWETPDGTSTGSAFTSGGSYYVAINTSDGYPASDFSCNHRWLLSAQNSVVVTWLVDGNPGTVSFRVANNWTNLTSSYNAGTDTATITATSPATGSPTAPVLKFVGTKRTPASATNTGVRRIRAITPGYESTPDQAITNEFVAMCADFADLRFMDFQRTNEDYTYTTDWLTRVTPIQARTSQQYKLDNTGFTAQGNPVEDIITICNATNRNAWINVPSLTTGSLTNSYEQGLATLCESTLSSNLNVILEYGNESPWNTAFPGFGYMTNQAAAEMRGFWNDGFSRSTRSATTAVRASNVLTVGFNYSHGLSNGENFQFLQFGATLGTFAAVVTVVNATTITVPSTGVDGTYTSEILNNSSARGSSKDVVTVLNYGASYDPYAAATKYSLRRIVQISDNVRSFVGDAKMMTRYQPVWCGQMVADHTNNLAFIVNGLGAAVNTKLKAFAGAPYHFGRRQSDNAYIQIGSPNSAGTSPYTVTYTKQDYIDAYLWTATSAKTTYRYEQHAVLAIQYGIELWCYEGGTDTFNYSSSGANATILAADALAKSQAIEDATFTATASGFCDDAAKYGPTKFIHYNMGLAALNGSGGLGNWNLTSTPSTISPKWQGIKNHAAAPVTTDRNIVPATIDGRAITGVFPPYAGNFPNLTVAERDWIIETATAGTYTLTVTYTCNFNGNTANVAVNGTNIAGGPFAFVNQGTGVSHDTLLLTPITTNFASKSITLNAGKNYVAVLRGQAQGDAVRIVSLAVV